MTAADAEEHLLSDQLILSASLTVLNPKELTVTAINEPRVYNNKRHHGNAGRCRWPQGRSLRCPPGSGRQEAPPSPDTGPRYPRIPAGTRTLARSEETR